MKLKYIFVYIFISKLFFAWAIEGDFEIAKDAYEKGSYRIAEAYLDNLLRVQPFGEHIADATHYLIKIYDKRGDFLKLHSYADRFLINHKYDNRCTGVLNLLLEKLIEREAFSIALDYIKNYDYLLNDYSILEKIGYGLFKQDRKVSAEYIFSMCPQTDTIKILRAAITTDFSKKREFYESIVGVKGKIYLMELLLESGDTIDVYEIYRSISEAEVKDDVLYQYTKISRLFDARKFTSLVKRLSKLSGYKNKVQLLEAFNFHYLDRSLIPSDREELMLLIEYLRQDTVPRNPPIGVNIDSVISDTLADDIIKSIRKNVGVNYYLDSIYCRLLLDNGKIDEAFNIIAPYLNYQNTKNYARKIRTLKYYREANYALAAKDILLSQAEVPGLLFVLADALTHIGKNSAFLYKEIIETSKDTSLIVRATRRLIRFSFENGEYKDVIKHKFDMFHNDTSLIKIYLYSLARLGKKEEADSLFSQFFEYRDYDFENYYGEYLIDKKRFTKADDYFNSIIRSADNTPPDRVYYNWALVSFLRAEIDTALNRFTVYINERKNGKDYYKALFKIATINYLKNQFDTAAYYYGLASKDDSLYYDALQNRLICYKKSGNWEAVVETGREILQLVSSDEKPDIQFEIGYAYLRSGNAREAVEHLKMAADLKSNPEFYYWLGEAYLAKGDFIRALYRYQKIVLSFPRDEMWTPTAHYKTGIVFEFMEELDEAKRIYEDIIKEYGVGDTWGIEARKRLEKIE